MNHVKRSRRMCVIGVLLAACCCRPWRTRRASPPPQSRAGQGRFGGVIPGASVTAVHQPSGTSYEAVTQGDGRFTIPGMRVGGPYSVTAQLSGFTTEVKNNITLALGVAQDLEFSLKVATLSETITVVGTSDPVFSTSHTGGRHGGHA